MTLDQILDVGSIAAGFFIGTATFWLAWRVHKHTQVTTNMNTFSSALQTIDSVNQLALATDDNLRIVDEMFADGRDASFEARRKRWLAFCVINSFFIRFQANRLGLIGDHYFNNTTEQTLTLILRDDEIMSLITDRGYDPDFIEYCKSLHGSNGVG